MVYWTCFQFFAWQTCEWYERMKVWIIILQIPWLQCPWPRHLTSLPGTLTNSQYTNNCMLLWIKVHVIIMLVTVIPLLVIIIILPVLQEYSFVDVNGLLVVWAHVVYGGQAQLVFCNVLQVLVKAHQLLLIVELETTKYVCEDSPSYRTCYAKSLAVSHRFPKRVCVPRGLCDHTARDTWGKCNSFLKLETLISSDSMTF